MSDRKRLVSDEQMARFNSIPNKQKVRQMQAAQEFLAMMDKFYQTDSNYLEKEKIVIEKAKEGIFAKHPPERWAELGRNLYLSLTAGTN